jgi:hypothetical protein
MGLKQAVLNARKLKEQLAGAADEMERLAGGANAIPSFDASATPAASVVTGGGGAAPAGGGGIVLGPTGAPVAGTTSARIGSGGGGGSAVDTAVGGGGPLALMARQAGWPGGWEAGVLAALGLPNTAANWLAVKQIVELYGEQPTAGGVQTLAAHMQAGVDAISTVSSRSGGGTSGGGGGAGRQAPFKVGPNGYGAGAGGVGGSVGIQPRRKGDASASTSPIPVEASDVADAVQRSGERIVSAVEKLERKIAQTDGGAGLRRQGLI